MKRPRHWIPSTAVVLMAWGVVSVAGSSPPHRPPPPPMHRVVTITSSNDEGAIQEGTKEPSSHILSKVGEIEDVVDDEEEEDIPQLGWSFSKTDTPEDSKKTSPTDTNDATTSSQLDSIFSFEDDTQQSKEAKDPSEKVAAEPMTTAAESPSDSEQSSSSPQQDLQQEEQSSWTRVPPPVPPRPDPPGQAASTRVTPLQQWQAPPPPGSSSDKWGRPPPTTPRQETNSNPQPQQQAPLRDSPSTQQQRPLDPSSAYRPPPGGPSYNQQQQPPPGMQQQQRPNPMLSQQHQYQNRPMTNRPIQQQRRQRARQTPAWKRVWRTIEGGLDSLADLEDGVMGRASQIYATTVETASSAIHKTTRRLPRSQQQQQQNDALDPVVSIDPTVHFAKRPDPRRPPSRQQNLQQPGNNFLAEHEARRQTQQQTTPTTQQRPAVETKQQGVNWNDVARGKTGRPILAANGGASSVPQGSPPNADPPLSPSPQQQQQQQQPPARQSLIPPTMTNPADSGRRGDFNALLHNTGAPAPSSSISNAPGQRKVTRPGLPPTRPTGQSGPPVRPKIYDDPDEKTSLGERLGSFLPKMPSLRLFRLRKDSYQDFSATMDAWNAEDGEKRKSRGFLGLWKKNSRQLSNSAPFASRSGERDAPVLTRSVSALQERCGQDNSQTLLKSFEITKCKKLGRKRAFFDLLALAMIIYSVREVVELSPLSLAQSGSELTEVALGMLSRLEDGWFYYAAMSALLAWATNFLVYGRVAENLASFIGDQVKREAQYGALFLRLFASSKTKASVIEHVKETTSAQTLATIESARLRTFTICLLGTLVLMTLSFVTPMALAFGDTMSKLVSIPELQVWPPKWGPLGEAIQSILIQFFQYVKSALKLEYQTLSEQPLQFAYDLSIIAVMLGVSSLPKMELLRQVKPATSEREEENGELAEAHAKQTSVISNLGGSSASRLQLASTRNAMDELLENWRTSSLAAQAIAGVKESVEPLIRMVSYAAVAGLLLVLPIVIYGKAGILKNVGPGSNLIQWDSLWEVGLVLLYTQSLFLSAINQSIDASHAKKSIVQFVTNFKAAAKERTLQLRSPPANLQLQASISPTTGLAVNDLWAAHAVRRAWAVRGASLVCQNGEVVVVLGDDASGKSRLLTTLGEAMLSPPKQAQTATRVRGSIALGGLDISKWDQNQLRKRVGLVLNDVRTAADLSESLSGQTLEEILEPTDGLLNKDLSRSVSSSTRACMILALKMTGLYSSLLPRLPSKLATVVTAKEDDLKPSALNPHSSILSPPEWTKLLVARVLCQTIFDNDNSASTTDRLEKSLLGTLLLLDDVTAHLSESEEGRFIRNLRLSGAASILTSTRWAMGRWADRIVVLKDGAVVESGTHGELLGRGPQQSLYAAKWHEMTSA